MKDFKIAGESSSVAEWGTVHSAEKALGKKLRARRKSDDRILSVSRFADALDFVHHGTKYLLHVVNVLCGANLKQFACGGQLNTQKSPPGVLTELKPAKMVRKHALRPKFRPQGLSCGDKRCFFRQEFI